MKEWNHKQHKTRKELENTERRTKTHVENGLQTSAKNQLGNTHEQTCNDLNLLEACGLVESHVCNNLAQHHFVININRERMRTHAVNIRLEFSFYLNLFLSSFCSLLSSVPSLSLYLTTSVSLSLYLSFSYCSAASRNHFSSHQ